MTIWIEFFWIYSIVPNNTSLFSHVSLLKRLSSYTSFFLHVFLLTRFIALNSRPIIAPISRNIVRLKEAPKAFGLGKLVGHTIFPCVLVPHVVWTPCMQFTPQSYSGKPIRLIFPAGPGLPPPPSLAVNNAGISSGFNRLIKLSTLSSSVSDVLQNG